MGEDKEGRNDQKRVTGCAIVVDQKEERRRSEGALWIAQRERAPGK